MAQLVDCFAVSHESFIDQFITSAITHFASYTLSLSPLLWWMLTEATFEVLPRLNEIKFGSGVIDELLFLDLPRECRFTTGVMMLEYGKAVQESVYEQLRIVREGQLRIIFTPDLKVIKYLTYNGRLFYSFYL